MATTYTVKKGDTLWGISQKYNTTVSKLAELNNISNPNYIVVGQVIKLSGTASKVATNTTSKAIIKVFGLQSNTDRTVYATWTWDKSNTENYQVKWEYDTGDGVWFVGNDSTVTAKQSTYNGPTNATRVRFRVKPISKKHKVNNKETSYWTAGWSTTKTYSYSSNPPSTPPVPTVTMDGLNLTASLNNLDLNASIIQFEVYKDDATKCKTGKAAIKTASASFSCMVTAGSRYKVRCRSNRSNLYSDWSGYSQNYNTVPATPSGITKCEAKDTDSIYVEWGSVPNADKYTIQYTDKKSLFDGTSDVSSATTTDNTTHWTLTKMESGKEWFIRVRAENSEGNSGWTEIKSAIIGTGPAAPTTWSSTTTAVVGEDITLYWVHNSEDGSSQTYAELEIYVDGKKIVTPTQDYTSETDKDVTRSYTINTAEYSEGAIIQWSVKTAGVSSTFGKSSAQRTIYVYQQPSLDLAVTNSAGSSLEIPICYRVNYDSDTGEYIATEEEISITSGTEVSDAKTTNGSQVYFGTDADEIEVYYCVIDINRLETFPFHISTSTAPTTQKPIGFYLSITSKDSYETVDDIGNVKMVTTGDVVYSKHFDTSEQLSLDILPSDVNLENNIEYTITCIASMDSGLTAEETFDFQVVWTDIMHFEPNAEITIDEETYSAYIRPYCEDEVGNLIEDVSLSVYRREFDGSFTELIANVDNANNTFITDPHPALDYARYRIVATYKKSGTISYCDIPGYPVGCTSVIIQWEEQWSSFDVSSEDTLEQPAWSGSMLKLPYNIDVSDKYTPDVSLIEYIGRKHPVSYYGTQTGESSTWNVSIRKDDKETLYALRRLALWKGNVYVREPSGSGYWANIKVSFNQKHLELIIPVTLNITRVEGGA